MGRWLIIIGILLIIIGLAWTYVPGLPSWFGKLPGDIRIEHENNRVYMPITSMVVASIVLTVLVNLVKRFLE